MKKVKIYISWKKRPQFTRISKAATVFFKHRIFNKDFDLSKWWISQFFDNKNLYTIFAHCGTWDLIDDDLQDFWARLYRNAIWFKKEGDFEIKLIFEKWFKYSLRYFVEKWALMAQMNDDYFKSKKEDKEKKKKSDSIKLEWIFYKKLYDIVWAIDIARELTAKPSNVVDPDYLEKYIKDNLEKSKGIKLKYFWQKEIEKEKMWLFLAVNQWSKFDAKMVVMEYEPKGSKWDPVVLVWKWLTYDSWGYYFKSSPHMNEMHADMAWAAAVIWVMAKLKSLWVKKKVIWLVWITENMIDKNSYKNWDIYTWRNWTTVEIGHTDAEWRLVLADMISYADDTYNPSLIIDIATLTWVCIYALGEMYTWIFSDNKKLIQKFQNIWEKVNDLVWPLPLDKHCKELVKWKMADISNTSKLSWTLWASTAAAFISNFVKDTKKWIHLDIAWTGMRGKMKKSYDIKNWVWTGSCVHMMLEYLMER